MQTCLLTVHSASLFIVAIRVILLLVQEIIWCDSVNLLLMVYNHEGSERVGLTGSGDCFSWMAAVAPAVVLGAGDLATPPSSPPHACAGCVAPSVTWHRWQMETECGGQIQAGVLAKQSRFPLRSLQCSHNSGSVTVVLSYDGAAFMRGLIGDCGSASLGKMGGGGEAVSTRWSVLRGTPVALLRVQLHQ